MKINPITLSIAFAIAALAGYGFFAANGMESDIPIANALGGGIALFVTLAGTIAVVTTDAKGSTMNLRVVSALFFVIMVIEQVIFCFVSFRLAPYIIVTGLLLLIYVLIAYGIGKSMR